MDVGGEEFLFTYRKWREPIAADNTENINELRREILGSKRLRARARTLLRQLEKSQGVNDTDFHGAIMGEILNRCVRRFGSSQLYLFLNQSVGSLFC